MDGISNLAERDGAVGLLATSDQAVSDAEHAIMQHTTRTITTSPTKPTATTRAATTEGDMTPPSVHAGASSTSLNGQRVEGKHNSKEVDEEVFQQAMDALMQEVGCCVVVL